MTTVGGLIVAIPSLAAFAVFRNRIDGLIAETGGQAQLAIAPIKRAFQTDNLPLPTQTLSFLPTPPGEPPPIKTTSAKAK